MMYPLAEVLLLVTCATIASCDDFDDIVAWGENHIEFLRRFSELHFGIEATNIINNTTGLTKDLVPGQNFMAEIKLMSAVTLRDILSPVDFVDYVESDIQQSEIVVFPPYLDLLKPKVRRVHIGTHGIDVHRALHRLFEQDGWEIVFSFEPNAKHRCALGSFETNDGVLTVRNAGF
jgi:hypothetical protein